MSLDTGIEKNKQILEVKDLAVEYDSENAAVKAVNGVSFSLNYGESLALVGETGAGKTTIAKSIMRILPEPQGKIKSGCINFDGENLLDLDEDSMRNIRGDRISMIFQDPMTALNPTMRIGRQISESIQLHQKVSLKEADAQAEKILERVGISKDRFREYPLQFSGGMKQRVVIAIALACNPDLLIADEPTSALDVTIQSQVIRLIKEMQEEHDASLLLITHDFGVVAESCDSVAVVYAGQIVEYGTKQQIFKNPLHPYTLGLFGALPNMQSTTEKLKPVKGMPPDPTHLPQGCLFHTRCEYANEDCLKNSVPLVDVGDNHLVRCSKCLGCQKEK